LEWDTYPVSYPSKPRTFAPAVLALVERVLATREREGGPHDYACKALRAVLADPDGQARARLDIETHIREEKYFRPVKRQPRDLIAAYYEAGDGDLRLYFDGEHHLDIIEALAEARATEEPAVAPPARASTPAAWLRIVG